MVDDVVVLDDAFQNQNTEENKGSQQRPLQYTQAMDFETLLPGDRVAGKRNDDTHQQQ